MQISTKTTFHWLDAEQRKAFKAKWEIVKSMSDKWFFSGNVNIQEGKKTLEDEIKDLEDLSIASYRALKLLKKQLAEGSRDNDCLDEHNTYAG